MSPLSNYDVCIIIGFVHYDVYHLVGFDRYEVFCIMTFVADYDVCCSEGLLQYQNLKFPITRKMYLKSFLAAFINKTLFSVLKSRNTVRHKTGKKGGTVLTTLAF